MRLAWLRSSQRASPAPRRWRLLVDGKELAALRDPQFDDMFWTSFEIVASTSPPDPRLREDAFWMGERWKLIDAATGSEASLAVASSAGLRDDGRRVVLRGLHAG
jgi:hypothetical protein